MGMGFRTHGRGLMDTHWRPPHPTQVQAKSSSDRHIVFPKHFCSCQSFFFEVVCKSEAVCVSPLQCMSALPASISHSPLAAVPHDCYAVQASAGGEAGQRAQDGAAGVRARPDSRRPVNAVTPCMSLRYDCLTYRYANK